MKKVEEDIKKIILARLLNIPPNHKLSIGSKGDFTIEELKNHVEREDEIGRMYIEMQLLFLRSMKKGLVTSV